MPELNPEDILNNGQYGKKPREVMNMLKRYGFDFRRSGKHLIFIHPEHVEKIPFVTMVQSGSADISPGAMLNIANACLLAAKLDREKLASTEGQATALPPWVDKAIDVRFSKSEDSDVMTLSHSSNGGPSRSYSIRNEGSTLYVLSNDFEGLWFELPYATEQKPVQAFQRKFTELDQEVSAILMESVDISGVTESDAGDSVSGELPSDDEARVYKRKKAGAASAIIEQGPSARDVRMIRAAGINRVSQAAFCFPVQASIGGEDFTLKELLDPDEYIFPTVSGAKVAQTTLRMLQAKANEIKALVGEIAVSITASEEVNGKSLNNRISEYVGLLRLLPQIREDMDNSTSGYVYVSNSEKYTAALSLENVPDTLINVMQAAKRHAVSAAERSDPHGFGRLV